MSTENVTADGVDSGRLGGLLAIGLRCPECAASGLARDGSSDGLRCGSCGTAFPAFNRRPVLLGRGNSLFKPSDYADQGRPAAQPSPWRSLLPGISVNLSASRCLERIKGELARKPAPSRVLVVGSGNQRKDLERLFHGLPVTIVCCDIDKSADVDLFGDAHNLPFADAAFDAVLITAVLEHVLDPQKVVSEIHRITRREGLVYSEIPFMQQVHEGAYDFIRYTLTGHRRLFRRFREIEAGQVAGPSTALLWSLENFLRSFSDAKAYRKAATLAVRLSLSWLKYLDHYLVSKKGAEDAASCTYFLGARSDAETSDDEIIAKYGGKRAVEHV